MRRFSQRNSLVTLSEINITPLLDLAFVLLIIFVITRPLLEQTVDLQLPKNMGAPDTRNYDRSNGRLVEITAKAEYRYQGRPMSFRQLEAKLAEDHRVNPKIFVNLRADKRVPWDAVLAVLDACERDHITQLSPKAAPAERP